MNSCSTSSTVTSSGMFTVLEIAPEMNGCTAPIIRTWPMYWIAASPIEVSNTGRCSALRCGASATELCSAMYSTTSVACSAV